MPHPHAKKPVLGVDLDNVLALTDPLIRRLIREMFGIHLGQGDIIHFDYWRCGITKEQDRAVFNRFHHSECATVAVIDGAVNALLSLHDDFEIHIVTGRPPITERSTLDWLETHGIPYDELDFRKRKEGSRVNFDAFVDDHRETAYALAHRGIYSFLFDYPWNEPEPIDPPNLIRVESWKEIQAHLERVFPQIVNKLETHSR